MTIVNKAFQAFAGESVAGPHAQAALRCGVYLCGDSTSLSDLTGLPRCKLHGGR